MQIKFDEWVSGFKKIGISISLLIIGGCSTELDPDRVYSATVPTTDLSFSIDVTISETPRWARIFLDIQPTKECLQTSGKSVLLSENDELSAYRSAQTDALTIIQPVPGSSVYTYKLTDSSPETPSAWDIRLTRNSGQEVFESTINVAALPDIEAPLNDAQYGPDDTLIFSWSTLLLTENNSANIEIDEIRIRQSDVEDGVVYRLPIDTYLQNSDIAHMEIPVADILQKLGQTELPIEFDYALSISDASDPELIIKNGLSININEDLARVCESGKGDLTVRQAWRSINISSAGFVDI